MPTKNRSARRCQIIASLLFPQLPIDAEPKSMICPFTRENPDRRAASLKILSPSPATRESNLFRRHGENRVIERLDRLAAHRTGGRVWVRDAVAGAGIYRAGPGRPVFGRNLDVEEIEHAAA